MRVVLERIAVVTIALVVWGVLKFARTKHEVTFTNEAETAIVVEVRVSDHSDAWTLELAPHESSTIRFLPDHDAHLEIDVGGRYRSASYGYFQPSRMFTECHEIRLGDTALDSKRCH
jgi:hypothetical protein